MMWRSKFLSLQILKFLRFLILIKLAKLLNYKIIWFAHNVLPHNYKSLNLEINARKFILKNFDYIVGLAKNTKEDLIINFGTCGKCYIAGQHGNYQYIYESPGQSSECFSTKKIKILLPYSASEYKGHRKFLQDVASLKTKNIILVIAGTIDAEIKDIISKSSIDTCFIYEDGIPHYEIPRLFNQVDIVALPYKKITTSGMYFLAVTYGKPVIAPKNSFFNSYISPDNGLQYEIDSVESLKNCFNMIDGGYVFNMEKINAQREKYQWINTINSLNEAIRNII